MTDHVQLGTEILSLDFDTLLCPTCRAKIEAAKAAQRALQNLNNLVTDRAPPAAAIPAIPGALLSRGERLEKGRQLLSAGPAPKHAVTTSNGTILAEPWRHGPKKKITAKAERDLEKVAMGTMGPHAWSKKHGYSNTLLRARLEQRARELGQAPAAPKTHVPPKTYVGTKGKLTDEQLERALNGELTPRQLALELEIPVGSIYRHLEAARKRRKRERKPELGLTSRGTPRVRRLSSDIQLAEEELQGLYDGRYTQRQIADRHGLASPSGVSRRLLEWQAERGLPEKKRSINPAVEIHVSEEDLRRYVLREVTLGEVAKKYRCSESAISIKAKKYALRHPELLAGPAPKKTEEGEDELLSKLAQVTTS